MYIQYPFLIYFFTLTNTLMGILAVDAFQSYEDEKNLLDHLFDPSCYRKSIRPISDRAETLQVNISHRIQNIQSVDVTKGEICTVSYLTLSWKDDLLRWNRSQFGDISVLDLPDGSYWSPLPETMETCEDDGIKTAKVSDDGIVHLLTVKHLATVCIIDMSLFPFDKHVCTFKFFNSKYSNAELTFQSAGETLIDENSFVENQEWNVVGTNNYNHNRTIQSLPVSFECATLTISRRTGFIFVNTFFPAWLLSFLNLFVPFIPPDSGERLSFAITACLAMMFVNMSVVDDMPRNSMKISLLSYNFLVANMMYTTGIIWSIFIICLSKTSTETRKIPSFIQRRVQKNKNKSRNKMNKNNEHVSDTKKPYNGGRDIETVNTPASLPEKLKDDVGWYEVSRYFDKLYFVVTLILATVTGVFTLVLLKDRLISSVI